MCDGGGILCQKLYPRLIMKYGKMLKGPHAGLRDDPKGFEGLGDG